MNEVYPNLYVGSDHDALGPILKTGWAVVSACKDGPYGHRAMLGYLQRGAPKDDNYLRIQKGLHLGLNLIDVDDPSFVDELTVNWALKLIHIWREQNKVLVHCNEGKSRAPSLALLYLGAIGALSENQGEATEAFRVAYPLFSPRAGMRGFLDKHYGRIRI